MPKGVPNKRYTAEFKQKVIETMRKDKLNYSETARRYEVNSVSRIQDWERIYLAEGPDGFKIERGGRGSKGRPVKFPKTVEEDLLAEVQRLRAENAYLKNLQALVLEDERHQQKNAGDSKAKARIFAGSTAVGRSISQSHLLLPSPTTNQIR